MGVLKDIWEIAQSKEDKYELSNFFSMKKNTDSNISYSSISKQAQSGVMQFPIICSRSLSYDTMLMVSKACERNFASLLQVIFTMNQVTYSSNPANFIAKYHQNTKMISGTGDIVRYVFNSIDVPDIYKNKLYHLNKESLLTFDEIFNVKPVNSIYRSKDTKRMVIENKNYYNDYLYDKTIVTEADDNNKRKTPTKDIKNETVRNVFLDSDVKKANELAPTMMTVRILKNISENNTKYIDFVVGVKAVIHPVETDDMTKHLINVLANHGTFFNLIRWTSGEISLFKDIIFQLDQIKTEIGETKAGDSLWWSTLRNMKATQRFRKYTGSDPILPNATFVISMEEVNYIKANYQYDLLKDGLGKKIMGEFSLLQFIIVDNASEIVYLLIDGQDKYIVNTFKGMEKASSDADKQFKEILRAVNKLQ